MKCWVISNYTNDCWLIDNDSSKPVYLVDGLPHYQEGELFNYHLSNTPPEEYMEKHCKEIEQSCEGYQWSLFDY